MHLTSTWADYIILAIIVFSALISLARGLVKEIISLASWIVGVIIAFKFYRALSFLLEGHIHSDIARMIVAFVALFLFVMILGSLISFLLARLISISGLGSIDKLLGAVFGGIRGVLFVTVLLVLVSFTDFVEEDWWKNSALIPRFDKLTTWLRGIIPDNMNKISEIVENKIQLRSDSDEKSVEEKGAKKGEN